VTSTFDLERFVAAQVPVYERVRTELATGAKASHWMWFIFPQLRGLGRNAMAEHFGLAGRAEAMANLAHPLLGARLRDCTRLVLDVSTKTALEIFGAPDDLKFHSSMTLFATAAPEEELFSRALDRYFGGQRDSSTENILGGA
jgi:uncharacterized protein (DUF1810 family)